jgi:hypothetical protein
MAVRTLLGAVLCCLVAGCSGDDAPRDSGAVTDQATHADVAPQVDGAVTPDSAPKVDGVVTTPDAAPAWSCTLDPGGGPFSSPHSDGCKWSWTCPTGGNHQLYCETISTASLTCTCTNTTTGATEKTFTSTDICTYSNQAIAAQANAHCGWMLP